MHGDDGSAAEQAAELHPVSHGSSGDGNDPHRRGLAVDHADDGFVGDDGAQCGCGSVTGDGDAISSLNSVHEPKGILVLDCRCLHAQVASPHFEKLLVEKLLEFRKGAALCAQIDHGDHAEKASDDGLADVQNVRIPFGHNSADSCDDPYSVLSENGNDGMFLPLFHKRILPFGMWGAVFRSSIGKL